MPNLFAYTALLAWPIVALVLFRTLPLQRALVWSVIGGHLLLPSATLIKVPLLPALDRASVVSFSALVLCLIYARKSERPLPDGKTFWRGLIALLAGAALLGPILTVAYNLEPLFYGPRFIPNLTAKDAGGLVIQSFLTLLPFWLGLRFLNTREGHLELLKALAISGVIYSFPALFEVRMSPRLHIWVYGFFQHDFAQHVRQGGFRPVVFLSHGLELGIFLCSAFLAALALFRDAVRNGSAAFFWFFAAAWLYLILIVSKNFGALAIGTVIAGFILFTGRRVQVIFAITVAVVVLLYPLLRGAGWIPVEWVLAQVEAMDQDRAGSLRFRLMNEETLLERAGEKPFFGWGSWGRNQIFDPVDGRMLSVTDGIWIILIGAYGWVGYIARFGLLTLPIIAFAVYRRSLGTSFAPLGLVLILCAALIDLIPNSALVVYVWLMAGGIAGHVLWKPAQNSTSASVAGSAGSVEAASSPFGAAPGQAAWLMRSEAGQVSRRSRRKGTTQRT